MRKKAVRRIIKTDEIGEICREFEGNYWSTAEGCPYETGIDMDQGPGQATNTSAGTGQALQPGLP